MAAGILTPMALEGSNPRLHYGDPVAEALACRDSAALFDFSFLECASVEGTGAQKLLESFCLRSLEPMQEGGIRYALRVDADFRCIADLTVWKKGPQQFEVMSGRREDIDDLLQEVSAQVDVTDLGKRRAVFAVQGPKSLDVLKALRTSERIEKLEYYGFRETELLGYRCIVGRLGYTGEAGFEILCDRSSARDLWQALALHARPAGFIAMDLLRIEAGFVLFTNEFCLRPTPAEIGLGRFCSISPPPPSIRLVAFRAEADNLSLPWKPSAALQRPSRSGEIAITSACCSRAAGGILGLGFMLSGTPASGQFEDRSGVFRGIKPVALPFYDSAKRRPRALWP